jgi:hypothetical protein
VDGAGIKQLVVQAPQLIQAGWGITETGGFPMYVAGRRLYPVKTAEKGVLWLTVRARGQAGHASLPPADNPVARLSAALARLARRDLRFALTEHSAGYLRALGRSSAENWERGGWGWTRAARSGSCVAWRPATRRPPVCGAAQHRGAHRGAGKRRMSSVGPKPRSTAVRCPASPVSNCWKRKAVRGRRSR